ncbi:MAG: PDZ domain-containing protein, partial [Muribaculaceae bacterium]|nr:PDZ domain-containing protein [Bacteroidales bacterium]MDY6185912.1 PDZ domain-containing protein [Muribaculaceae bacterium]
AASIVSGNLARHNKVDLGEQIIGNIATSAIEIGLNAIFDALWKPSKTVWILEGRFRRVNKYLLQGTLSYQSKKVNVDGKVSNKTSWTQEYSYTRYNPDDHIYWAGWRFGITTPYAWLTKYIDARKDQFIPAKKDKKHFNAHQSLKIWYLSHVRALDEGVDDDLYYQINMTQADSLKQASYIAPYMGVAFNSVDSIFRKKNKWAPEQGAVITDFDKDRSAALLAGLKKNDVIVEVGPYPITDNASFSKAISHFKPYEVVNVVVQRKKKRLTIPVELSAWLRPYDTKEEE